MYVRRGLKLKKLWTRTQVVHRRCCWRGWRVVGVGEAVGDEREGEGDAVGHFHVLLGVGGGIKMDAILIN